MRARQINERDVSTICRECRLDSVKAEFVIELTLTHSTAISLCLACTLKLGASITAVISTYDEASVSLARARIVEATVAAHEIIKKKGGGSWEV